MHKNTVSIQCPDSGEPIVLSAYVSGTAWPCEIEADTVGAVGWEDVAPDTGNWLGLIDRNREWRSIHAARAFLAKHGVDSMDLQDLFS